MNSFFLLNKQEDLTKIFQKDDKSFSELQNTKSDFNKKLSNVTQIQAQIGKESEKIDESILKLQNEIETLKRKKNDIQDDYKAIFFQFFSLLFSNKIFDIIFQIKISCGAMVQFKFKIL